jgi:branched-chain amino acid transport system permease protein
MWDQIINMLFGGTASGAMYALVAIGFSLVYGVGGVLNLAHGGFFILTGYLVFWTLSLFNNAVWLSICVSLIIITIIGGITYLLLIKPLQDSELSVVLVTFALAFFFEHFIRVVWGSEYETILELVIFPGSTDFFGVSLINQLIFLILVSLTIVIIFMVSINRLKIGKSIRAVSQDREAATLMGINANRILMYTVMISAFLAGLAAILYLPTQTLSPVGGWGVLTNAFAVVILGGMGSLLGSIIGAFILGFANSFTSVFIPNGPSWAHIVPIIIIVLVLLIRPQGLFGKKEIY